MSFEEKAVPGYDIHSEAYYATAATLPEHVTEEVTVGLYYLKDGGANGEFAVRWRHLGDHGTAPCLEVFSDAWSVLVGGMPRGFLNALAELGTEKPEDVTPQRFVAMLKRFDFVDLTEREAPPHRAKRD